MLPKAWSVIAAEAQERARYPERHGFKRTASDLYLRAAVMYGRAQYSVFDGADARKAAGWSWTSTARPSSDCCIRLPAR